jgi:hypothetical protein
MEYATCPWNDQPHHPIDPFGERTQRDRRIHVGDGCIDEARSSSSVMAVNAVPFFKNLRFMTFPSK